jgi:hypothetical protein
MSTSIFGNCIPSGTSFICSAVDRITLNRRFLSHFQRAAVTDLDRFKLYVAKQRRNRLIKKHYKPLLKKARKEPVKKAPKKHKHAKGPYVKRT